MIERRKVDSGGRRLNKGRRIEDGTDMKRSYILPHFAVTPAPAVPTVLTAVAVSSSQINLSWVASAGPSLKDYGVYRQGAGLLGFVTATSFSDTGLAAGTAYTYFVTARNLALVESAPSNFASATTQSGASGFIPNAALGVTVLSGSFVNGQTLSLNLPGGGLGARANPKPLYYWPMGEDGSTTFATHATLSRTAKTLTGSLGSAVIQNSVMPPNALGAFKYIPTTSSPGHTAFSDGPMWSLTGGTGSHAYLFMKRYWAFSAAPGNCKLWRLWNGATSHSVMFLTQTPSNEWGCGIDGNVLTTGIAHPTFFAAGSLNWPGLNKWNTDEWFWQEPTQNTYDGIHQWARQAEMAYEMAGRFNCLGSDSLMGPGPLVNGYWEEFTPTNGIPNGTTDIGYYGIMYVDDSWLQLIVTDEGANYQTAYIYTSPTPFNREIQIQTARSDTSITFVVRKGSHASLIGKHLLAVTGYGTAIDLGVGA